MPFFETGPLNYRPNSANSLKRFQLDRAPTSADYKNFNLGDLWLDTDSNDWWILCDISSASGTWRKLAGTSGASESFIVDSGTSPVIPDTNNEVTITGGTGLETVGSTNTITINIDDDLAQTYTTDSGTATPTANNIDILGGNGTATGGAGDKVSVIMQSPFVGDWDFKNTTAATPVTLSVSNDDTDATSFSSLVIGVANGSLADTFTSFEITGTKTYSLGIDNSDSDKIKLTDGSDPSSGNEILSIDPTSSNAITINNAYTLPTADGSADQVLTTNGAGVVTWESNSTTGTVVQQVRSDVSTYLSTTSIVPFDDTIPQISEGSSADSLIITPSDASNILLIEYTAWSSSTAASGTSAVFSIFRDSGVNAIQSCVTAFPAASQSTTTVKMRHYVTAGSTSPTTFSIRYGSSNGLRVAINGAGGGRKLGGSAAATLTITEYTP